MTPKVNVSKLEPEDLEATHFPECGVSVDDDAICSCNDIEIDLREAFAEMTRGDM